MDALRKLKLVGGKNSKKKENKQPAYEKTEMTAEFEQGRRSYIEYKATVAELLHVTEACIQPDAHVIAAAKGGDDIAYVEGTGPYEDLAHRLNSFRRSCKATPAYEKAVKAAVKAAKTIPNEQRRMSVVLNPMRQFPNAEFKRYQHSIALFDDARDKMDRAKYAVVQSATTIEIEKNALLYKAAVDNFDEYCTKATKIVEDLPLVKKKHGQILAKEIKAQKEFHNKMAEIWKLN